MFTPASREGARLARVGITLLAALSGLAILTGPAAASDADRYQEIELAWPSASQREVLRTLPELELMHLEPEESVRYLSRPHLTETLRDLGFDPTVIVEDLETFYADRLRAEHRGSEGWTNFGAFLTYDEAVTLLDDLHAAYPDITTEKMSIGTTWEGRDIWAIKISDNPNVQENEPEVLLDALHHARETITVSVVTSFAQDLCSNYGVEPEATFLVDNRQIWIVPVVNPDGYVWNETTNPNGGGMWRKNRRDNAGSSCYGVDLNRNYGYEWGGAGTSPDPCNDLYHGPGPFSEPETQTMRDFSNAHEFVTQNSFHSVVGVHLHPWGFTPTPTPDDAIFAQVGEEMSRDSGYPTQAAYFLYPTTGNTMDWAYGDLTGKPKIFAYTTEVDGSGFWPTEAELPGLVAENMWTCYYLALVAGSYVLVDDVVVEGGDGNGRLDPGETVDLVATLRNDGVIADATAVSLILTSDDAYVQIVEAQSPYGDLAAGASGSNAGDPLVVTVDPSTPDGHMAVLRFTAQWEDGSNDIAATFVVGQLPVLAADDFESGNNGWTITNDAVTGDWMLIDPNPTEFQPGDDTTPDPGVTAWITAQNTAVGSHDVDDGVNTLESPSLDLSGLASASMAFNYFFGQRDPGDDAEDWLRIDLSNDGGATYPANVVLVGDESHPAVWTPLQIRVEDFLPLSTQVRLRIQASDGTFTGDIIEAGLDDFFVFDGGTGNTAPGAPSLVSPPDGASDQPADVALVVGNAFDVDGDALTYGFRLYADALLTNVVRSVDGVVEGAGTTSWMVDPPLADGQYWWRAFAEDAEERGPFMTVASFTVGEVVAVPGSATVARSTVMPPSPNPFAAATTIRFQLAEVGQVRVEVFDVGGRRVRSLYRGILPVGPQSLTWDGRTQSGGRAAAGEYFVQVTLDGQVFTRKVVVLD